MHGYAAGTEFGEGGLYALPNNTTKGISIKIHPNLPAQEANSVWTFDGTLPPKLLMARYGEPILFRHFNALPIDPSANNSFGMHTISTHEHNGHNPGESDGFTHAYSYPGQYYDYRWPMILAGHDSVKGDTKAGAPDGKGGIQLINGDSRETMSTHWFHDHMLDYTAQNVYKGNAAMMNYYSAIDRGNEAINDGVNLRLPSGTSLDWGNRDYDVNLLVADKAWNNKGQLYFNVFNTDGFVADKVTVNWQYKPYLDVRARKYRFRILNGSVSRFFKIALVDDKNNRVPFHMIANDGNIMQHAIPFPNAQSADLPSQGIAERYDIVVDFKGLAGRKLYLVNLLEHQNGLGPKSAVPLADVLSGKYKADGKNGDPAVGKFLEFRVQDYKGTDLSMNPADYVEGKKQMIPLPKPSTSELKTAVHRTFEFGKSNGTDTQPWTIKTDGGQGLNMDPHIVSAAPEMGKLEIWHIKNSSNAWSHPVHVHFEEGQILKRGGKAPPLWEKYARKDVYRIGALADSTDTVDIAIRFREFAGTYVEHCHNTQHEDKAMLLRWDVRNPGQIIPMATPMPEWEGVVYDPTITLPTYLIGDTKAAASFTLP
jgi:FtsP/CotA-like multicopper oxidase with cupredoxin domain